MIDDDKIINLAERQIELKKQIKKENDTNIMIDNTVNNMNENDIQMTEEEEKK